MSKVNKHGKEGHEVRGDIPCDDGPLRYKLPRSSHRALSHITGSSEALYAIANTTTAERVNVHSDWIANSNSVQVIHSDLESNWIPFFRGQPNFFSLQENITTCLDALHLYLQSQPEGCLHVEGGQWNASIINRVFDPPASVALWELVGKHEGSCVDVVPTHQGTQVKEQILWELDTTWTNMP